MWLLLLLHLLVFPRFWSILWSIPMESEASYGLLWSIPMETGASFGLPRSILWNLEHLLDSLGASHGIWSILRSPLKHPHGNWSIFRTPSEHPMESGASFGLPWSIPWNLEHLLDSLGASCGIRSILQPPLKHPHGIWSIDLELLMLLLLRLLLLWFFWRLLHFRCDPRECSRGSLKPSRIIGSLLQDSIGSFTLQKRERETPCQDFNLKRSNIRSQIHPKSLPDSMRPWRILPILKIP